MNIRAAVLSDLPALTEIYNHYIRTSPATFDLNPYTTAERETWFHSYQSNGRYRLLIIETNGQFQGYATSSPFNPKAAYHTSVTTSIYLHPQAAGQGLGSQLYKALFDILSHEPLHRAYAGVTQPNPASVALHKKFGFKQVGTYHEAGQKFGRFWDVTWYEKRLNTTIMQN